MPTPEPAPLPPTPFLFGKKKKMFNLPLDKELLEKLEPLMEAERMTLHELCICALTMADACLEIKVIYGNTPVIRYPSQRWEILQELTVEPDLSRPTAVRVTELEMPPLLKAEFSPAAMSVIGHHVMRWFLNPAYKMLTTGAMIKVCNHATGKLETYEQQSI